MMCFPMFIDNRLRDDGCERNELCPEQPYEGDSVSGNIPWHASKPRTDQANKNIWQMTSTNIKFKCKSWIDTMGQRGAKASGSLITNAFANSLADLIRLVLGIAFLFHVCFLISSYICFDTVMETWLV